MRITITRAEFEASKTAALAVIRAAGDRVNKDETFESLAAHLRLRNIGGLDANNDLFWDFSEEYTIEVLETIEGFSEPIGGLLMAAKGVVKSFKFIVQRLEKDLNKIRNRFRKEVMKYEEVEKKSDL